MEAVTEEDAKKWLGLAQQWRTSQQHGETWRYMEELAKFLEKLELELTKQGNPKAVLQHFPSVGKLLGTLGQIPALQCSGEISQKLVSCTMSLASHSPEFSDDNVTKRAVSWAQSQLRNMTRSSSPDPSILSIGEFMSFTPQETTETYIKQLIDSICCDLRGFEGVAWNSDISDLVPVTPLHGTFIRRLSELCLPMISHAAAIPLIEALLSCVTKATDIIKRDTDNSLCLMTDCLSPLFLENLGKISACSEFQLSYSAKVNLWCQHQPSFENEIFQFVDTAMSVTGDQSIESVKQMLQSCDLLRACTEHTDLGITAEQLLW